jgi:hypothetical protein
MLATRRSRTEIGLGDEIRFSFALVARAIFALALAMENARTRRYIAWPKARAASPHTTLRPAYVGVTSRQP